MPRVKHAKQLLVGRPFDALHELNDWLFLLFEEFLFDTIENSGILRSFILLFLNFLYLHNMNENIRQRLSQLSILLIFCPYCLTLELFFCLPHLVWTTTVSTTCMTS